MIPERHGADKPGLAVAGTATIDIRGRPGRG